VLLLFLVRPNEAEHVSASILLRDAVQVQQRADVDRCCATLAVLDSAQGAVRRRTDHLARDAGGGPPMNHDDDTVPTPTRPGWGQSLYSRAAGVALLHAVRTRAGGEDDGDALRPWAAAMVKGPIQAVPEACGLYEGAPAVAYDLSFLPTDTVSRALATLDTYLADITRHRL
jgi:hypothetical protein